MPFLVPALSDIVCVCVCVCVCVALTSKFHAFVHLSCFITAFRYTEITGVG